MKLRKINDISEVEVGSICMYGNIRTRPEDTRLYIVGSYIDNEAVWDNMTLISLEGGGIGQPFTYQQTTLVREFCLAITPLELKFKHLQRIIYQLIKAGEEISFKEALLELDI